MALKATKLKLSNIPYRISLRAPHTVDYPTSRFKLMIRGDWCEIKKPLNRLKNGNKWACVRQGSLGISGSVYKFLTIPSTFPRSAPNLPFATVSRRLTHKNKESPRTHQSLRMPATPTRRGTSTVATLRHQWAPPNPTVAYSFT